MENRTEAVSGKKPDFPGKNGIYSVIFGGQISPCGIFWGEKFSTDVDSK
jgi:hypothetical protein